MRNEWTDRKKAREDEAETATLRDQIRAEIKAELEQEYNDKLVQAYEIISAERDEDRKKLAAMYEEKLAKAQESFRLEMQQAERIAEEGYAQAYEIIRQLQQRLEDQGKDPSFAVPGDGIFPKLEKLEPDSQLQIALKTIMELRARLDSQKDEMEKHMEEGFEEAYSMLQEERAKTNSLEVQLYEEYEEKLKDIKSFIVDKVDRFLRIKWEELTQADDQRQAALLEAWRKAVPASYMVEDAINSTFDGEGKEIEPESQKYKEAKAQDEEVAELKTQIKILEARHIRLEMQNRKLEEHVRETQQLMLQQNEGIQKEREQLGLPPRPVVNLGAGLLGAKQKMKRVLPPSQVPTDIPENMQQRLIARRIREFRDGVQTMPNVYAKQADGFKEAPPQPAYDGPDNKRSDEPEEMQ